MASAAVGIGLAAALALAGCDGSTDQDMASDAMPGDAIGPGMMPSDAMPSDATPLDGLPERPALAPGEVRYVLAWDDTGLDVAPDGTWSVTNDLDQRFTIRRGWLTSYSAQLVPCSVFEGTAAGLGDFLWSLVGGVAHAGHDDEPDPSLFEIPHVEPLVGRSPRVLGTVSGVPSQTYCKAFYLVARSDDSAVGVPSTVSYDRVTLYLEGTWQGGGAVHDFVLSTDLNIGRNLDLLTAGGRAPEDALRLDPSEGGVEVIVYRRIAGWFDGLDLGGYPDDVRLARALMPKVVEALWVEVR